MGAVIFSGFVCLGQAVIAMGANVNSYAVMFAGRFVFGLVCVYVCVCMCVVYVLCVYVCVVCMCSRQGTYILFGSIG